MFETLRSPRSPGERLAQDKIRGTKNKLKVYKRERRLEAIAVGLTAIPSLAKLLTTGRPASSYERSKKYFKRYHRDVGAERRRLSIDRDSFHRERSRRLGRVATSRRRSHGYNNPSGRRPMPPSAVLNMDSLNSHMDHRTPNSL